MRASTALETLRTIHTKMWKSQFQHINLEENIVYST